uniref:Suckerin-1 n=1 Tax=Sepioteuthis lessoniana TaxID=34570 RepID=A0A081DU96_SEPLE
MAAKLLTLLAVIALSNYAYALLPGLMGGYGYPAATTYRRTTLNGYGGLYGGLGYHYPAATAVSHTTHHAPYGYGGLYGGWGYPAAASVSTVHRPVGYGGWGLGGYGLGGYGLGYGLHYPAATVGYSGLGLGYGSGYVL